MGEIIEHTIRRPAPKSVRRRAGSLDKWIGFEILRLREAARFTRTDLGDRLGLSQQQIAKYETGTSRIAISTFLNIAEALEVEPDAVLSRIIDLKRRFVERPQAPGTGEAGRKAG